MERLPAEARLRRVSAEIHEVSRNMRRNPTNAEHVFWQAVRGSKVAGVRFRRQHAVSTYILDFYCPSRKLVIEIDGEVDELADIAERDRLREERLRAAGCRVLRFTNAEVLHDIETVLVRLKEAISQQC